MSRQPKTIRSLDDLTPDDRNVNRGTDRGATLIRKSLRDYGAGQVSLEWDAPEIEALAADFGIELGEVGFNEGELDPPAAGAPAEPPAEVPVGEAFQVVVECANEDDQRQVYERMTAEGYKCRVLTL